MAKDDFCHECLRRGMHEVKCSHYGELREESATPEELEDQVQKILKGMVEDSPTFKALQRYRPLVRNLSVEEYAGLRMAVEEDRARRLGEMFVKYPFLMKHLEDHPDVDDR